MADQLPTTMRAVRQRGYGGVEVLDLGEVPVPKPGPGQVLVRVVTPAVDRVQPLAEAAAAITRLAAGEVRGKVVLSVRPGTMTP